MPLVPRRTGVVGQLAFTDDQRSRLREQGVIEEQLIALEQRLPLCRSFWTDAAPLTDVRAELKKLDGLLSRAIKHVGKLEDSHKPPVRKARREAYTRLLLALQDSEVDADSLQSLHDIARATGRALADLGTGKQRRPYSASPRPVKVIDEALHSGWYKQEPPILKSYPFCAKSGLTSKFRVIVGICYEAFTRKPGMDPERAIKAYVTWRKAARSGRTEKALVEDEVKN